MEKGKPAAMIGILERYSSIAGSRLPTYIRLSSRGRALLGAPVVVGCCGVLEDAYDRGFFVIDAEFEEVLMME